MKGLKRSRDVLADNGVEEEAEGFEPVRDSDDPKEDDQHDSVDIKRPRLEA